MKQRKPSSSNGPTETSAHPSTQSKAEACCRLEPTASEAPRHTQPCQTLAAAPRYLHYDTRLMMLVFGASSSPGGRVMLKEQHLGSSRFLWTPQSDTGTSFSLCLSSLNPGDCSLMDGQKGQGCMFSLLSMHSLRGSSDFPFPALKCRSSLVGEQHGVLSVAVTNTMTKCNLERKGFTSAHRLG